MSRFHEIPYRMLASGLHVRARFGIQEKKSMRFTVFWRISVRFSDPPYAPLLKHEQITGRVSSLNSTHLQSCSKMLFRMDSVFSSHLKPTHTWPQTDIFQSIGGKLRLLNNTEEPLLVRN